MSATARSASARPGTAAGRSPGARSSVRRRPVLTEVPPARAAVAGRGVFALVVVGLLVVGMGLLLVLNTSLAQGAFELNALTKAQRQLAVQDQQLLQQVALAESPDALQQRADQLGMVPAAAPVFLRLADGAVLGTPVPAVGPTRRQPPTALLPVTGATTTTTTLPPAPVAAGSAAAAAAVAAPTAAAPTAAGRTAAAPKAAAPKAGGLAAVADPAPQSYAAVPDPTTPTTATGARR